MSPKVSFPPTMSTQSLLLPNERVLRVPMSAKAQPFPGSKIPSFITWVWLQTRKPKNSWCPCGFPLKPTISGQAREPPFQQNKMDGCPSGAWVRDAFQRVWYLCGRPDSFEFLCPNPRISFLGPWSLWIASFQAKGPLNPESQQGNPRLSIEPLEVPDRDT